MIKTWIMKNSVCGCPTFELIRSESHYGLLPYWQYFIHILLQTDREANNVLCYQTIVNDYSECPLGIKGRHSSWRAVLSASPLPPAKLVLWLTPVAVASSSAAAPVHRLWRYLLDENRLLLGFLRHFFVNLINRLGIVLITPWDPAILRIN